MERKQPAHGSRQTAQWLTSKQVDTAEDNQVWSGGQRATGGSREVANEGNQRKEGKTRLQNEPESTKHDNDVFKDIQSQCNMASDTGKKTSLVMFHLII